MSIRVGSTRTGGVLLRDVADGDLSTFFEHQQDPVANRMAGFPPRDRDAFVAHWKGILADGTVTKKTILFDGRVAGNVVSFEHSGRREVGYWIGGEYWGKGVATEALSQFLGRAEVRRPLHAAVPRHNAASIRVLEKCGFTLVGEEDGEYLLRLRADRATRRPRPTQPPGMRPSHPGEQVRESGPDFGETAPGRQVDGSDQKNTMTGASIFCSRSRSLMLLLSRPRASLLDASQRRSVRNPSFAVRMANAQRAFVGTR